MAADNSSLRYLLGFNGEEIRYEGGYIARFKVVEVEISDERPFGVAYSLSFHDPNGKRLMGFDNAHPVSRRGGRVGSRMKVHDHWHRDETDTGRPYKFTDAESLIVAFFDQIERILKEREKW